MGNRWEIKGTLLIACSCDYGCPCNVNGRPTTGDCEGGWTWHIDSGQYDGTSLDGLNFAIFADWPGAIHEGNGVAICYVDERADDAQRAALTTIARGEAGGPWGIFINTYELHGPFFAPFEVEIVEGASRYKIGDAVEMSMTTIKNPVSGLDVHPRLLMPEGLLTNDIGLYASEKFRVSGDVVAYDHSGRYTAMGAFANGGE